MATLEEIIGYFTDPTATGYTVEKTLIFALLLVGAVYVIYEVFKKLKIRIDKKLAIGLTPYVVLGGTLRVLQDAGTFNTWWLITPGIYVFVFLIAMTILALALLLERKFGIPYYKTFFVAGLLLIAVFLPMIKFVNGTGFGLVALVYIPWLLILHKIKWNTPNKLAASAQMFDASSTFVAIQYFGYYEQHVVPSLFINIFSPVSFIFLKVVGIVSILLVLDKFAEDREFNNYLKMIIAILGLGTGTRDFLRLLALV